MTKYEIEFSYKLPEWGAITLDGNSIDEVEDLAMQYIKDTYEDITDIQIDTVQELKA